MSPWIHTDDQPSDGGALRPGLIVIKNCDGETESTISSDGEIRAVRHPRRKSRRPRLHQDGLALAWRLTRRLPRSWRKRIFKKRQSEKDFEDARRRGRSSR